MATRLTTVVSIMIVHLLSQEIVLAAVLREATSKSSYQFVDLNLQSTVEARCQDQSHDFAGEVCIYAVESTNKQCPFGFHLEGNICIYKSPVVCPNGTKQVGRKCVSSTPTCPEGYKIHYKNLCSSKEPVCNYGESGCVCRSAYALHDKTCVVPCGDGTSYYQKQCLKDPHCPRGFYEDVKMDACVLASCRNSSEFNTSICPSYEGCPGNKFSHDSKCKDKCPEGTMVFNRFCIQVRNEKCSLGYFELGEFCIPKCPLDFIVYVRSCVRSTSMKCRDPMKRIFYNNVCVSSCPEDYNYDSHTNSCTRKCPKPYFLYENSCTTTECPMDTFVNLRQRSCDSLLKCPEKYKTFNEMCVEQCPQNHQEVAENCLRTSQCMSGITLNGLCIDHCVPGTVEVGGDCVSRTYGNCGSNQMVHFCHPDQKSCKQECECKKGFTKSSAVIRGKPKEFCVPQFTSVDLQLPWDIFFVVDGSSAITETDFDSFKRTIADSIISLGQERNKLKVAFILTGKNPPYESRMTSITGPDTILEMISHLTLSRSADFSLGAAVRVINEVILNGDNRDVRPEVAKMIILMINSTTLRENEQRDELIQELRNSNIKRYKTAIISIGLTNNMPVFTKKLSRESGGLLPMLVDNINSFLADAASCPLGYVVEGGSCVDEDECKTNPCHKSATCINTIGSFTCFCSSLKYVSKTRGCVNETQEYIDENAPCQNVDCEEPGYCVVKGQGIPECTCGIGFIYRDGIGCVDYDECANSSIFRPCTDKSAQCINLIGSYRCACNPGYRYSPKYGCTDVNECTGTVKPCSGKSSVCKNTPGSYECRCSHGLYYDERLGCLDVDECKKTNPPACTKPSTCHNTEGSFECRCPQGLEYDSEDGCTFKQTSEVKRLNLRLWILLNPRVIRTAGPAVEHAIADFLAKLEVKKEAVAIEVRMSDDPAELVNAEPFPIYNTNQFKKVFKSLSEKGVEFTIDTVTAEWKRIVTATNRATNDHLLIFFDAKNLFFTSNQMPSAPMSESLIIVVGKISSDISSTASPKSWMHISEVHHLRIFVGKLLLQFCIEKLSCPPGFGFTGSLCQKRESALRYCDIGARIIPPGTRMNINCAEYSCSEDGELDLDVKKCLGFDGECYDKMQVYPCWLLGERKQKCKCKERTANKGGFFKEGLTYMGKDIIDYKPVVSLFMTSTKNLKVNFGYNIFYFILFWMTWMFLSYNYIPMDFCEVCFEIIRTTDDQNCYIPFKYNQQWHYSCIGASTPWCSYTEFFDSRNTKMGDCKSKMSYGVECRDPITSKYYRIDDEWRHDCNTLQCTESGIFIRVGCKAHGPIGCVKENEDGYVCQINNKSFQNCHCGTDENNLGKNEIINPGCFFLENQFKNFGDIWTSGCNTFKCWENSTVIAVDKKCADGLGECHEVNDSAIFDCADPKGTGRTFLCHCRMSESGEAILFVQH